MNYRKFTQYLYLLAFLPLWACTSGGGSATSHPITTNVPLISPGATTQVIITNSSGKPLINPAVKLASWLNQIAENKNLNYQGVLNQGESHTFSFSLANTEANIELVRWHYQDILTNLRSNTIQINTNQPVVNPVLEVSVAPDPAYLPLTEDILINADLWSDKPEIMAAGYGFEGIEGVMQGESYVVAAGGAWECNITTPNPPYRALTSTTTSSGVSIDFGYPTFFADAMPIVFSWPVLPSTVDPKDFAVTLNTGEVVTPFVASLSPNLEYNERSTVVIFGEFGNRLAPGETGAVYPVNVAIVSKLKLVGPNGPISAVGLSKNSTNPYQANSGPTLVAAKLSFMSIAGEGIQNASAFEANFPNNGVSYYGAESAQYRLRVYTSGGFSPDGVAAVQPQDFNKFFRIQVIQNGIESWVTTPGVVYNFPSAGNIEVVGLADLGVAGEAQNDAYVEDFDNYIDIILKGDEAAMRLIKAVEIPGLSQPGYLQFYNPGGPGSCPTPGIIYTSPGPYVLQSVTMALDNPLTVNYP